MTVPGASVNVAEAALGILLLFFLPGYAVTKALFPEWRIRGEVAVLRLLEVLTLSFVLSIALTVLIGYALLVGTPGGFQAFWSNPLLESLLGVVAAVALAAAWARGAFAREAPRPMPTEPAGELAAWPVVEELDRLRREERRLRHRLRVADSGSAEAHELATQLERVRAESSQLQARREEEYAG